MFLASIPERGARILACAPRSAGRCGCGAARSREAASLGSRVARRVSFARVSLAIAMAAPSDAGRDPFGMGTTDDGTRVDDGYLSDLLSFSVTQLNREPERLKEQGERAVIARRETAQRRYDAFVGASECYDVVRREVADVERGLEAMRASLPALRAGCQAFAVRAEQISKARAAHRRTLANQSALLDLLEAPSLQDTCVRHGNYDEALEIQSFVDKATRRHGEKKIAALAQIAEGSRNASDAMLSSLLDKLRDPHIALPECLKVVGVLRRSDAMDETALRRAFLRCRESAVADAAAAAEGADAYEYVKRLTDAHRTSVFDVATQYRAIFAEDEEDEESLDEARTDDRAAYERSRLLRSWCAHRTNEYLRRLEQTVPAIDEGARLAAAHEHARYCAASLARAGMEYRPLLVPIFANAASALYASCLADAARDFERVVETHRWTGVGGSAAGVLAESRADDKEGEETREKDSSNAEQESLPPVPPRALLEHVPVASFVNGVLRALNELRHCAPGLGGASVRAACADETKQALTRAATALASTRARLFGVDGKKSNAAGFVARDGETMDAARRAAFSGACKALADVAAPYLVSCFGRVFKKGERDVDARAAVKPLTDAMLKF